jgi:hypothetical protein
MYRKCSNDLENLGKKLNQLNLNRMVSMANYIGIIQNFTENFTREELKWQMYLLAKIYTSSC